MSMKRKTTAVVAGVTAAALMLGGTFAWTSISQTALNESAGIVNVGGRLHDDFDGENKDVYVENFTDPLNGGQPIYARVKLTEYMEVGSEAGQADNLDRKATPVVAGTDINDDDTWTVHKPETDCAVCETEGTCRIHSHWEWTMGGQTTFMPTFNKDKDSLAADINGTYAGTNADDKVYYDDYVTYVTQNNGGDGTESGVTVDLTNNTVDGVKVEIPAGTDANALTEANKDVTTVIGTEYYDDDTDNEDNDGTRQVENVTHTAKQTANGDVITMSEWVNDYDKAPGNYWVYDTDGWAYWANPIMPGEATGLLLSNIKMTQNPGEKCYYAINVVAQFATVGDWEYFDGTEENGVFDGTGAAKELLETVSKNVATVVVTNESGATLLIPGESYEFSANVYVDGIAKYAAADFDWSVLNADGTANTKSTITVDEDGKAMLNVAENENSKNLIVVAKAINSDYLGALGMSSVAVDVEEIVIAEELKELAAAEVATKVTIDNIDWWVLAKEDANALIWAVNVIPDKAMTFEPIEWSDSEPRSYLNNEYLETLDVLKKYAAEKTIYTANTYDRSDTYVETNDKVFLLSEADVFGTANGTATTEAKEYTLGKADVIVTPEMQPSNGRSWLRTKRYSSDAVAALTSDGQADWRNNKVPNTYVYLRPAMWVSLEAISEPDITLYGEETIHLPQETGESKSYKLAFDGSALPVEVTTPEKFCLSGAYLNDGSSVELTEETDYTYDPATQTLTVTQKAEGVRFEFLYEGEPNYVYGLNFSVPVTPTTAGFMEEAYYNNTYMGVMVLNDEENVFYKVNLTEDGTPLALTDIQLSGEYNNGVTYDPETNLLFVPEPSTMTTFLKAKYEESDVYILAMSEQSSPKALYLTNRNNMNGSSMEFDGKVYKGTYTPGHSYEIQADVIDPWTLVFEAAEGHPLDDGLAIATMFFYGVEGAPADRGTSYLCIPADYVAEIYLQGYYYDDSNERHEVSIILTGE